MKLTLLLIAFLITSSYSSNVLFTSQKARKIMAKLNINRYLQQKTKADAPDAKIYTPLSPPKFNNGGKWKESRDVYYAAETERLAAQTKFHTSEFQRYVIQEDLNDQRQSIEKDESKSIKSRLEAIKDLSTEFQLKISKEDVIINNNKNMRNPANQAAANAHNKMWKQYDTTYNARQAELKAVKVTKTTRRMQAVFTYSTEQKAAITK